MNKKKLFSLGRKGKKRKRNAKAGRIKLDVRRRGRREEAERIT